MVVSGDSVLVDATRQTPYFEEIGAIGAGAAGAVATLAATTGAGAGVGSATIVGSGGAGHLGRNGDGRGRRRAPARRTQCGSRPGARSGDGVELVADVDPDRAPGDAAAAADAAGAPELVPPGRELVGEPLPVAILDPRPETPAGDGREARREAAVPAPLGERFLAVEVGPLADARAEAGRADEGAVRAGEAAVGDLRPVRVVEVGEQPCRQAVGVDRVANRASCGGDGGRGRGPVLGVGRGQRESIGERLPGRGPDPDDESVIELGQCDVEPVANLGTGSHRGAEAGRRCGHAFDGHDERIRPPRGVVGIDRRTVLQDAVLDAEGGELAGAHAQERVGDLRAFDGREGDRTAVSPADRQRHAWREREPLPGGRADDVVEQPVAATLHEPVLARRLVGRDAVRQLVHAVDLVVHHGAVAGRRSDDPASVRGELVEERLEIGSREPADGVARAGHGLLGHHGSRSCWANRSRSWSRVAASRRLTAWRTRG